MKVYYGRKADALYFQLSELTPDGVVELHEGINLDVSEDGKISGKEISNASQTLDLQKILTFQGRHGVCPTFIFILSLIQPWLFHQVCIPRVGTHRFRLGQPDYRVFIGSFAGILQAFECWINRS
jgi:uncharacterized protein YuzE